MDENKDKPNWRKLTDHAKSLLLATAMGEMVRPVLINPIQVMMNKAPRETIDVIFYTSDAGYVTETTDLYTDKESVDLAWRAIYWAADTERKNNEEFIFWLREHHWFNIEKFGLARRVILDRILELAIDAGAIVLTRIEVEDDQSE